MAGQSCMAQPSRQPTPGSLHHSSSTWPRSIALLGHRSTLQCSRSLAPWWSSMTSSGRGPCSSGNSNWPG
eukprot:5226725-Lingulodinium_polyedra.AAC.1